ncbi:MAG TPA: class I SAM-dependent methyltransferase [Solirubrobacterales bacterium]|nr:class I SAM-dependent methyltransferase [Solirubrobacterales bacterium]
MATEVDYDTHGRGYARRRLADPRFAARIEAALGDARTVVNVGAGAGSYEPRDRWVLAVEPSATMRAQRGPDAAPCLAGAAESLPLDDDSVDAAMACVTIHHWADRAAGLAELRRVARGPVVVFTFELNDLIPWQRDYFAEPIAIEQPRFGTVEEIAAELGGRVRIETMPTPADCTDGFFEAFWNRPELLLDPSVRASQSIWELLEPGVEERIFERLGADLESGRWDADHGGLRELPSYEGSLRLVISEPG